MVPLQTCSCRQQAPCKPSPSAPCRASVAAAPANRQLEPEPEPAPIQAEPSHIWSSHHFSRLPLSRLGPAEPPFFCSCPILPLRLGRPVPLMPSLFSRSCTTSSPLKSQKPSTTFRQVWPRFQLKFYLRYGHRSHPPIVDTLTNNKHHRSPPVGARILLPLLFSPRRPWPR